MKKLIYLVLALPLAVSAATLTAVPMQGGMAMPMIAYSSVDSRLHVMMPMEVPQLTPLLISNPADSFDVGDPWFSNLDPSAQGYSFSRRYGFVMDEATEPLPANTAIWLRKLSGSPELGFYRYSGSAPKAWEPIFGTAGSATSRYWNGMMFHPGVSAPPGTNGLSATFEAYLVDTLAGTEIPASGTGPMVLTFTNVSDGRPQVGMSLMPALTWSAADTNWVTEWATSLTATVWTVVTNPPTLVNGQPALLIETSTNSLFYRMRRNP